MRRIARELPIECPPSTPIKLPIFPLLNASSIPVSSNARENSLLEMVSGITDCRRDEFKDVRIRLHHTMNDVNLLPGFGYCVFVLSGAADVR